MRNRSERQVLISFLNVIKQHKKGIVPTRLMMKTNTNVRLQKKYMCDLFELGLIEKIPYKKKRSLIKLNPRGQIFRNHFFLLNSVEGEFGLDEKYR